MDSDNNQLDLENNLIQSISPNPAQNYAELLLNQTTESNVQISEATISGKVVIMQNITTRAGSSTTKINTENLANGIYMVKVTSDSKAEIIKLIINK